MKIIECVTPDKMMATFEVMQQLRPHLEKADYLTAMDRLDDDGARLIAAFDGEECLGCAVFRPQFRLTFGDIVYVDDLVTRDDKRSSGVGAALLDWIEQDAKANNATMLILDSGVQRERAHRFYFRQGLAITSFNFKKPL